MNPFMGEIIGTMLLITLGQGAVANVLLNKTKGNSSGLIVITTGWAIAVFVGVFCVGSISGAHLNPAITLALAITGKFSWQNVPLYITGQMLGAMIGASINWIQYRQHFDATNDPDLKLAVFCTSPAIKSFANNIVSEIIGTFVLVIAVLYIANPQVGLGAISALPVALVVLGIGISLGGTTGYAINPARDLGPRIMHAILPIKNKRDSDWHYSLIPVLGPAVGAILAALLYIYLH